MFGCGPSRCVRVWSIVGVMKHVGDALGDTIVQARNNIVTIGIAPWGVVHKNTDLIGQDVIDYSFITLALIPNHNCFLTLAPRLALPQPKP